MTKKIAWITDSTSSLDKDFIEKHPHVHIVPLNIIFGDVSYREHVDITDEQFYEKLRTVKELPKSSQPAIGDFVTLYEMLKEEFDCAIAVHCSSKLSGTLQSSKTAAEMVGFDVSFVDSKIGSYPISKMIQKGVQLHIDGESVKTIVSTLEDMTSKSRLFFTPSNMEQLHKSGRVSGTQVLLGNLLKIKLILGFEDGKVEIKDKVRSDKKAKSKLFTLLEDDKNQYSITEVAVVHCNNLEAATEWKDELDKLHPSITFIVMPFIPVVGVHTGEGTVGLSWINI